MRRDRRRERHRPRAVHEVRAGGRARRAVGPQPGGLRARGRADRRAARSRPTSVARRTSRTSSSATVERFGRIDLFVSNAGIAIDGGIDTPTDKWQKIIDVNLMSEVFAAKYAIPHMLEQGSGYLLNVASAAGLLVIFDTVSYTVTKHAAIGFTEWLAATYDDQGIGVSVLVPGGRA